MYFSDDYFGSYNTTDPTPFVVVGVILAIAITVLLGVFVLPERRRAQLGGFFRTVADIFNFKGLIIKKILKYLYIFFTFFFFLLGFFMLFWQSYGSSMALQGFLVMIISPFAVRITFEAMMLFILLVKNVIEINSKLGKRSENTPEFKGVDQFEASVAYNAEQAPTAPGQQNIVFCPHCGTQYDTSLGNFCPNCGKQP